MPPRYHGSAYSPANFILKRAIDLALILIASPILLPLTFLIALAIKLDSPGPVLFTQKRAGIHCIPFDCVKFRTMYKDADQSIHQKHIEAYTAGKLDESEGVKLTNDKRVTRVGKLLRVASLDELPQVINVLRGEMSLVGPRPLPMYEVEQFKLWHSERFLVLPGITGLWQVQGRSYVSFNDQLRLDIQYVRKWSPWLDILLIIQTIPAVLSRKGAG